MLATVLGIVLIVVGAATLHYHNTAPAPEPQTDADTDRAITKFAGWALVVVGLVVVCAVSYNVA